MGPGSTDLLPPRALKALEEAEVIVGYKTYIQLLPPEILIGKQVISTGMRQEIARVNQAIDQALTGCKTVLVCSGDPGIYALAGLVYELLDARGQNNLQAEHLQPEIIPGIPALAAGAALLGAPLTHDFACISLSDLLTPWKKIERRIQAAAQADFVLVIYNPKSKKRTWQLSRLKELLLEILPPGTPVGIVRQASRKGEEVILCTLQTLDPEKVDMLSLVIIGNAQSRVIAGKLVTPRGYLDKYGQNGQG